MRFAILILFLSGCATQTNPYEAQWEQRKIFWLSQFIDVNCPSTRGAKECGLITESIYGGLHQFVQDCEKQKIISDQCNQQFFNMMLAKWRLRYPEADWDQANLWCQANVKICDFSTWEGASLFEMQLVSTHNKSIARQAGLEFEQLQTRADIGALERQKAMMNIFGHAFDSRTQNVNCTSNSYGSTSHTDCQ